MFGSELCVLRTFGSVDFSLVFICVQSVSEFLWDGLHASIEFPVMPKHAQYARFGGELDTLQSRESAVLFLRTNLQFLSENSGCSNIPERLIDQISDS